MLEATKFCHSLSAALRPSALMPAAPPKASAAHPSRSEMNCRPGQHLQTVSIFPICSCVYSSSAVSNPALLVSFLPSCRLLQRMPAVQMWGFQMVQMVRALMTSRGKQSAAISPSAAAAWWPLRSAVVMRATSEYSRLSPSALSNASWELFNTHR